MARLDLPDGAALTLMRTAAGTLELHTPGAPLSGLTRESADDLQGGECFLLWENEILDVSVCVWATPTGSGVRVTVEPSSEDVDEFSDAQHDPAFKNIVDTPPRPATWDVPTPAWAAFLAALQAATTPAA